MYDKYEQQLSSQDTGSRGVQEVMIVCIQADLVYVGTRSEEVKDQNL